MPLPLLLAILWGQGAVGFGIAAFFFTLHIVSPEMQQFPLLQERLNRYPAWRRKFTYIYSRAASLVMLLGVAVCLIFVGITVSAGLRPDAPYARPTDFVNAFVWAMVIFATQVFVIAMCFLQYWRGRRTLRRMAREATQRRQAAAEDAGQPASSAAQ